MFDFCETRILGCFDIRPRVFEDNRGHFIKVFHEEQFRSHGIEAKFAEEYYSVSRKGVLRGLHFQIPPMDYVKMVYCVAGTVLDAIVDLRVGSPTYGTFKLIELSAEKANLVFLPSGLAHGFLTLSDQAILIYKVSTAHSPEHDSGILWNSVGIPWPEPSPILSDRDRSFPTLAAFVSPFRYVK